MSKKSFFILILMIISSMFIYGCQIAPDDIAPSTVTLEDSIKEIIISKGEGYDFLQDELFIRKINELGIEHDFTLGNLDDDNIPELVVFVERNPEDTNDQGKLEVYKFSGEKYEILDSVNMNYDNSNYLLIVGKISENQNGILLSNQVGGNAGVTYGYILEDGKLKGILNDKKIPLISVTTENKIEDIDGDGILEFSIYSIDPETKDTNPETSDKMVLWYKWDEKDSGILVQIDRLYNDASNEVMVMGANTKGVNNDLYLSHLSEHIEEYNKYELTDVIKDHIEILNNTKDNRSIELNNLYIKYQEGNNFDYLNNKYGLSLERLNDIDYLKREKVLQSEPDLKNNLIHSLNMGYRIQMAEGSYYYEVNYQKFVDLFGEFITKEYRDYLKINSKNTNNPILADGALVITRDKIAERIVEIENFRLTYPYSNYIDEINTIYEKYVVNFIYGNVNTPNYDDTNKYSEGSIAVFQDTINKYPESHFADILQNTISILNTNLNILTDEIKENINNLII
ncbi:hypothetical protein [Tissierella sp. Yu-01]|uniref:hypothetical protein n=1 Tax=Tissierella sp. Yu-01 TaxID=3035694 RepID=UPI00240E44A8|nr:hypothetical protein [Tissierella sp. Yu-01]WFA08805.1 hypothetical protein P3962_13920 [Tissierella sp. Yu-01]